MWVGRVADAIKLFEEALPVMKGKVPDHQFTFNCMSALATSYGYAGRTQEALKLHEETLQLKKTKLGPDHPDTLSSMNNLANVLQDLGRYGEAEPLKKVFGDHARKLAVSSTKSMTGHLLGAAGGLEAGITALAVHHQVAPPTINLDCLDPACDLDYVPKVARDMKIDHALSNSFGFGGTNATLVFQRYNA